VNDRNRRLNASDELERARRLMRSADWMLAEGLCEEAVSSAYYAAHHAARALLFSLGLEVRSHGGLRSLLAEHFERPGHLPRGSVKTLKDALEARMSADYGVRVHFSRAEAERWVRWSRQFVDTAANHLAPFFASSPDDAGPSSVREPRVRYRPSTGSGRVLKRTRKTPVKSVRQGPVRKRTT